jgi:hypothetical protein
MLQLCESTSGVKLMSLGGTQDRLMRMQSNTTCLHSVLKVKGKGVWVSVGTAPQFMVSTQDVGDRLVRGPGCFNPGERVFH